MRIAIQIPAVTPLNTFFDYLKIRAADPVHEDNVDLIADFIDKVLVVELKRLANEQETITQNLDIPDQAMQPLIAPMIEPYLRAKAQFDSLWAKISGGALPITNPPPTLNEYSGSTQPTVPTHEEDEELRKYLEILPEPHQTTTMPTPVKRTGNGHKSKKVRSLLDAEKDTIRAEFVAINGQIAEDACKPIHSKMDPEISIFQVTGFVTYLHSKVAAGALQLKDLSAYVEFLKGHRKLWATYDSPKYRALRQKNGVA